MLFGWLLEKAGAGNYFIKVAFALLGHMRGGPAKAAVVSSGMMGMISGSSVANVVTCGTFTIPLMKRVGYTAEKAGAIEAAAGVDGQIMPPVMGAAAFLMAEYVGVPYAEIFKNAFLPAFISYIALFYIVHLEAAKAGIQGLPRASTAPIHRCGCCAASDDALRLVILAASSTTAWAGSRTCSRGGASGSSLGLIAVSMSRCCASSRPSPTSRIDDPKAAVIELPALKETALAGLHFLLPVVLLIWVLMVEHLSPGLSAFYATTLLIVILLTQKPLIAMFRGEPRSRARLRDGLDDLVDGLGSAARAT